MTTTVPARLQYLAAELGPKDIREVCRVRDLLLRWSVAPTELLTTVQLIRLEYIKRVGLKRYILEALGSFNTSLPVESCVVYDAEKRRCQGSRQVGGATTVLDFLMAFPPEELPYLVEINTGNKKLTLSL